MALTDLTIRIRFLLALLLVTGCACTAALIRVPDAFAHRHIAFTYGLVLLLPVAVVLLVQLLLAALRSVTGKAPAEWRASFFRDLDPLLLIMAWALVSLTLGAFTIYKSQISAQGFHWDQTFIALDRFLLFGHDGWRLTHAVVSSANATWWLDFIYHPAFLPMTIGVILALVCRRAAALRYTYLLAFPLSFLLIGMFAADLLISAGPIFEGAVFGDGTIYGPLQDKLMVQYGESGHLSAWAARSYLLSAYNSGTVTLGAGISAMPSMHVAMAASLVPAAWHINRWLGVAMLGYLLLIWFTSVHLGWHYFADGLLSLIIFAPLWYACGLVCGLYGARR